jgi:hypothetical protein
MKPIHFVVAGVVFAAAGYLVIQRPMSIGSTSRTDALPRSDADQERIEKARTAQARSELRNLATLQEAFFADSGHYIGTLQDVRVLWARRNGNYRMPTYLALIEADGDVAGWTAQIRSPRHLCTIAVGNRPRSDSIAEGQPACVPAAYDPGLERGIGPVSTNLDTAAALRLLRTIATEEAAFFAENAHYTNDLRRFEGHLGAIDTLHLPVGFTMPIVAVTANGWNAHIKSAANGYCWIIVGPDAGVGKEGRPFCTAQ